MVDAERDHDGGEHHRHNDEEVTDLEHRLLRVAGGTGACHQLGGAAEERVRAGGDDNRVHLALLDHAARVSFVADFLGHRQGFTGECGLIYGCVIAIHHPQVGRHDDSEADLDDVTRHQRRGLHRLPLAVPHGDGFGRKPLLERRQRTRCLPILPHLKCDIEQKQCRDDREVFPVADRCGHQRCRLDHIGNRPRETPQELRREALLLLDQGIRAVSTETLLRLRAAQPPVGLNIQLGDDFANRRLLEIDLRARCLPGRGRRRRQDGLRHDSNPRTVYSAQMNVHFTHNARRRPNGTTRFSEKHP